MINFNSMKKKKESKYNAWNEYLNNTKERTNYAIRRFDLLIISISGGGIYILFETLREFKTNNVEIENPKLLLFSGLLLIIAIVINLFSQYTGYWSNNFEEKYINLELSKIKGEGIDKKQQKKLNRKVKTLNFWTELFNISSLLLMIIGIILLTVFNFSLF
jgi:hypothetical protein